LHQALDPVGLKAHGQKKKKKQGRGDWSLLPSGGPSSNEKRSKKKVRGNEQMGLTEGKKASPLFAKTKKNEGGEKRKRHALGKGFDKEEVCPQHVV